MLDCGEGAQIQLRRSKIKFSNINNIFITHLHGDHCFGLIPLISTFALLGRTSTMHIWGPRGLIKVFQPQLDFFCQGLSYKVELHEVDTHTPQIIYEDRSVTIETIPLKHKMPTCGYLFREKELQKHIRRDAIDAFGIPVSQINNIKTGMDWTSPDGEIVPNHLLTTPADPARSYAYCTDTVYKPDICEQIQGVDLLYHEATFSNEHKVLATTNYHCTASEAATIAKQANVKKLMIGHVSSRYKDEGMLLREAKAIFGETTLANDGICIKL